MASRMTPERVAEFVKRYQNGETIYKISKDMEVTYKTVKMHLEKEGVYDVNRVDKRYKSEVFKMPPKDRSANSNSKKKGKVSKDFISESTVESVKVVEEGVKNKRKPFVYGENLTTGNEDVIKSCDDTDLPIKPQQNPVTVTPSGMSLNFAEVTATGIKKPKKLQKNKEDKNKQVDKKPMSKQKIAYLDKKYGKGNWYVMSKAELLDCLLIELLEK